MDDVIDVRFRLFKGCLLQHWQFFMGNPRTNKKPNQNGQQFFESSMMEILKTFHSAGFGLAGNSNGQSSNGTNGTGGGMMVVSPERVRYNLKTLKQLHRVHKLFASCSSELRVQCLTVCLNMIGKYFSEGAARERSTVVDISIPLPSFKLISLSFSRSPLF